MNSPKQKLINNIVKTFDRMDMELRGSKITDEEFNVLVLRTNKFLMELRLRTVGNPRTNQKAYDEAMLKLMQIRDLAKK